jgi:hypothetical protein
LHKLIYWLARLDEWKMWLVDVKRVISISEFVCFFPDSDSILFINCKEWWICWIRESWKCPNNKLSRQSINLPLFLISLQVCFFRIFKNWFSNCRKSTFDSTLKFWQSGVLLSSLISFVRPFQLRNCTLENFNCLQLKSIILEMQTSKKL